MTCSSCGKEAKPKAGSCPSCGKDWAPAVSKAFESMVEEAVSYGDGRGHDDRVAKAATLFPGGGGGDPGFSEDEDEDDFAEPEPVNVRVNGDLTPAEVSLVSYATGSIYKSYDEVTPGDIASLSELGWSVPALRLRTSAIIARVHG